MSAGLRIPRLASYCARSQKWLLATLYCIYSTPGKICRNIFFFGNRLLVINIFFLRSLIYIYKSHHFLKDNFVLYSFHIRLYLVGLYTCNWKRKEMFLIGYCTLSAAKILLFLKNYDLQFVNLCVSFIILCS